MENLFIDPTLLLIIAAFAGFFMAFGIGANDVAKLWEHLLVVRLLLLNKLF